MDGGSLYNPTHHTTPRQLHEIYSTQLHSQRLERGGPSWNWGKWGLKEYIWRDPSLGVLLGASCRTRAFGSRAARNIYLWLYLTLYARSHCTFTRQKYCDDRGLFFLQSYEPRVKNKDAVVRRQRYFRPPRSDTASDGVIGTAMKRRIPWHLTHPCQRPLRPLRPPKLLQIKTAIFPAAYIVTSSIQVYVISK